MAEHAYTATRVRSAERGAEREGAGPGGPLALAFGCATALVLLWAIAEHVRAVQVKDAALLYHLTRLSRPGIESLGSAVLPLLSPAPFVLWGIALVAVALLQGRPRTGVAVAAVMALSTLTTETLKPIAGTAHVRAGEVLIGPHSWPSGHSTAALALALCAVLVAPRRLRPVLAAVGAGFALLVGGLLLILAWHMPSDVLAGYLVASMWMALAVTALRAAELRWPTRRTRTGQGSRVG